MRTLFSPILFCVHIVCVTMAARETERGSTEQCSELVESRATALVRSDPYNERVFLVHSILITFLRLFTVFRAIVCPRIVY